MRFMVLLPLLALAAVRAPAAAPLPYGGLPIDYSYVALADMALAAPVAIAADIVAALPVKGAAASGVAPGETRFFVRASTRALVSGRADLPPEVTYLVDLPNDVRGKPLKLRNIPVLLLATPPTPAGELRLIGPHAQVPRTPENEARLRAILRDRLAPDAPPAVTGITRAFHVPGSLPGESETQIFLRTADARPISLTVLRRPGEAPRWAVALTEMVDNSAAPPARDTLLWYRLACGLPAALPDTALADLGEEDAAATREDYRLVRDGLGPCRHAD